VSLQVLITIPAFSNKLYLRIPGLFLLLLLHCFSCGQVALLSGIVADSATNKPLPGVHVYIDKTTGTYSEVDGSYLLEANPGNYTVNFSFLVMKHCRWKYRWILKVKTCWMSGS
jgi:hypothetical protein